MAKFKVGDRVLVARKQFYFSREMEKYVGHEFTISSIDLDLVHLSDETGRKLGRILCEQFNPWYFHEDCLELAGPYTRYHWIARQICGGDR